MDYGLHYYGFPTILEGFDYVNWISNSHEIKSTNRLCVYIKS